jgi:hypothetical protein
MLMVQGYATYTSAFDNESEYKTIYVSFLIGGERKWELVKIYCTSLKMV